MSDRKQRAPEECWIWLIWGLKKDRCDLIAIASTEEARDRYVYFGLRHGYQHVQHEEVMTNHLYGERMLGRAFSEQRLRRRRTA